MDIEQDKIDQQYASRKSEQDYADKVRAYLSVHPEAAATPADVASVPGGAKVPEQPIGDAKPAADAAAPKEDFWTRVDNGLAQGVGNIPGLGKPGEPQTPEQLDKLTHFALGIAQSQPDIASVGGEASGITSQIKERVQKWWNGSKEAAPAAVAPEVTPATPHATPEGATTELAQKQIDALKEVKVGKSIATEFGRPDIASTVSEEETIAQGQALRAKLEPFDGVRRPNMAAHTAAVSLVYQDEAKALGEDARALMSKASAGEDVTAASEALKNRFSAFAVNYANIAGLRSETGRSLQILDPLKPGNAFVTETAKLAQQLGDNPAQLAEALSKLSPEGAARMARQVAEAQQQGHSLWDGISEFYKGNLLSTPKPITRHITGNSISVLTSIPTRAIAAQMPGSTVEAGEASAMVRGIKDGFWDAMRYGYASAKSGQPEFESDLGVGFVEHKPVITSANAGLDPESGLGRAVDYAGNLVRLPFRGLTAADQWFKVVNHSMEMHALAWRDALGQAADAGLEGPEAMKHAEQVYEATLKDPPTSMITAAKDFSALQTFSNKIEGKVPEALQSIAQAPGMNLVMPFFKTPYNIFKTGVDYSPLGVASQWSALKGGGAAADIAKAKIAMGSTLAGVTAYETIQGNISGDGPRNPDALAALKRTGWQPNSMRVGDHWVEIPEPFRQPMTLVANTVELMHELDEPTAGQFATAAVLATARSFSNASFVQGLANLREALAEASDKGVGAVGERFIGKTLAGLVPASAALAALNRTQDPTIRNAQGVLDQVKSRIPGLAQDLPPKRDIYGNVVAGLPGVPQNFLFPINITAEKPDAVDKEIIDVQPHFMQVPKYISGRAAKALDNPNDPDIGVALTPKEQDQWAILRGDGLKDRLQTLIATPGYQNSSTLVKRQLMESIASVNEEVATNKLLASDPSLMSRYIDRQKAKVNAMRPPENVAAAPGVR